jgi:hypothetical protein
MFSETMDLFWGKGFLLGHCIILGTKDLFWDKGFLLGQ